jgi:hypothetical protein
MPKADRVHSTPPTNTSPTRSGDAIRNRIRLIVAERRLPESKIKKGQIVKNGGDRA